MTSVFDGMAGVISATLGASATYLPVTGSAAQIRGVFREEPIEVAREDGSVVLIEAPTMRVSRAVLADVRRGDRFLLADGRTFKVLNRIGTGSPAADAFFVYELELVP